MKQTSPVKNSPSPKRKVIIGIVAVVVILAGVAAFFFISEQMGKYTAENAEQKALASSVKIKSLPINIDTYNPATGKAGDVVFPKESFGQGLQDMIFYPYGLVMPSENNAQRVDKVNPQPTFLAPVGTKVLALIDGEVVAVNGMYSNDFTIHMQAKDSNLIFETEHVINVMV